MSLVRRLGKENFSRVRQTASVKPNALHYLVFEEAEEELKSSSEAGPHGRPQARGNAAGREAPDD